MHCPPALNRHGLPGVIPRSGVPRCFIRPRMDPTAFFKPRDAFELGPRC
jgi:hypothetical protein